MDLRRLPNELLASIAQHLEPGDIFSLAQTTSRLSFLVYDEAVCRNALRIHEPALFTTVKASSQPRYADALRQLCKRCSALRTVEPFAAAIIANAESFILSRGALCYITKSEDGDRQARVLRLRQSSSSETVLDIGDMVDDLVGDPPRSVSFTIRCVHFCEGILSLHYIEKQPFRKHWLLVVDVNAGKLLTAHHLEENYLLFVRNDANHLYHGTYTGLDDDGNRSWVLTGYHIKCNTWLKPKIHLRDFVGQDIDVAVCFEVFDGYFYALSSQADEETEALDWTSYYYCRRFPLGNHCASKVETSSKPLLWRRDHIEGPIDERWSILQLSKDRFGQLQITEGRKEWPQCRSTWRRSYYTTKLVFPDIDDGLRLTDSGSPQSRALAGPEALLSSPVLAHQPVEHARDPLSVHHGDEASATTTYALSQVHIRSYPGTDTFLDLVEDAQTAHPAETGQQAMKLRIRCGTRSRLPAIEQGPNAPDSFPRRQKEVSREQACNTIACWPPENSDTRPGTQLAELQNILNPTGKRAAVIGAADDRTVVYTVGDHKYGLKPLVLVSFDPTLSLRGLKYWADLAQKPSTTRPAPRRYSSPEHEQERKSLQQSKRKREKSWIWQETPLCSAIGKGFDFGFTNRAYTGPDMQ